MTPRDDLDGQATSGRAERRKNQRTRQAGRLVARAEWLDALLVFWTGERQDVPRLADTLLPLRAVLQDRLAELPAGLYAVRAGFPESVSPAGRRGRSAPAGDAAAVGGPLRLEVTAIDAVTRERVAETARAIEAAARYPKAGARLVGSVDRWRQDGVARLDAHRRAVESVGAWRAGAPGALALEARAFWLGAGVPPSAALAESALASWTGDAREHDPPAGQLAAVALGRRHLLACHARLSPWAAVGRRLDRWPAAAVRWAATAVGPETLAALAAAAPSLNDALAATWAEERAIDRTATTIEEIAGLARLLSAIAAIRKEPARRHHYASPYEDPPDSLSHDVLPASALDPAGAAVAVTVANRLRWKGASHACEMMAAWLDTCRPLGRLAPFWRDVLAIVPSGTTQFDADSARALASSLECHGRSVATELAPGCSDEATQARALLPAVLARGPDATGQVIRRQLWLADADALDAALRWIDEAERLLPARGADPHIPVPRVVFDVADPALRDALLAIGLRVWGDGHASAHEVERLLAILAEEVSQSGAVYWNASRSVLVDVVAPLMRRVLARAPATTRATDGEAPRLVPIILDVCARWARAGFGDTRRLARILADRWTSAGEADDAWRRDDADRNELLIRLSEGRIPRLLALLQAPPAARKYAWRAVGGWALVEAHPMARAWVSACLDRTELVPRVVHLLERIALVARLDPGLTAARFFGPLDQVPDVTPTWPPPVAPDACVVLNQIALASTLTGVAGGMPGALRRIFDRAATVETELAVLRARAGRQTLSASERARLVKLERLLAEPEARAADLRGQLARALPKQLALAGLAALEWLAKRDLERRWRHVLGSDCPSVDSAAWDNALHMLATVKQNRRMLVRVLRRAARGDVGWTRNLGPNEAFLAALAGAGVRPDEWLAERSLVVASPSGSLRASATTDPLEVLQMGSLFGTCLSAGRFNAHAAVAAAVEVNKRVLYVKDDAGRVLGRQLLALTRTGEMIGFTCYGAGAEEPWRHGAWVKLALELLALDIARASGARLMPDTRLSSGLDAADERSLMLFCPGYVDSPESFDWWIEALAAAEPRSGENDRALLRSLLERPVQPDLDARTCPAWKRDVLGWAACRALLWLGAEAPSLSTEQAEALGLGASQRALLRPGVPS